MEEKMANDVNRVQSIQDKISDIDFHGKQVVSNYILEKKDSTSTTPESLQRYKFESVSDFVEWKEKNRAFYMSKLKKRMTPH